MKLNTKYQQSRPSGSDKKFFSRFSYISLCKTIDRGGAIFGPGALIEQTL